MNCLYVRDGLKITARLSDLQPVSLWFLLSLLLCTLTLLRTVLESTQTECGNCFPLIFSIMVNCSYRRRLQGIPECITYRMQPILQISTSLAEEAAIDVKCNCCSIAICCRLTWTERCLAAITMHMRMPLVFNLNYRLTAAQILNSLTVFKLTTA